MTAPSSDGVFAHSTPVLYDRYMGPLLFERYAELVAERCALLKPYHSARRGRCCRLPVSPTIHSLTWSVGRSATAIVRGSNVTCSLQGSLTQRSRR